jgi:cbb3-type cytochrome c oxidase subunit III
MREPIGQPEYDWDATGAPPVFRSSAQGVLLALLVLLVLWSVSADAAPAPRAKGDAASLYHNYCSVCHGDRGDGRSRAAASLSTPPANFTNPQAAQALTIERMFDAVKNGRPGTAMAGWKTQLTDEQIMALVRYVRDTFMQPAVSPAVNRGRALYGTHCAGCHGQHGQGGAVQAAGTSVAVPGFRSPQAADRLTREAMIRTVTNGRPGTAMAGFGGRLAREDIEAVVEFVRASFMLPPVPAVSGTSAHGPAAAAGAGVDMRQPLPGGLKGDPARGRALYMANCVACHGAAGDGNGPRAYFINPKPRVLTDAAARARFNRPALYAAIAEGRLRSEMPAWNKVLTQQEIADVVEFVFESFIRPAGRVPARESG